MNFDDVSKLRDAKKILKDITKKTLVVYSITSVEINKIDLDNKNCFYISSKEFTKDVSNIDKIISRYSDIEEVYTIGAGTATDIGKYISYKLGLKLTSIITMLSTNVYATDKVALIVDGKKVTLQSKMPDLIIIDEEIMKKAFKFNLYGLADVFSIYTALKDWNVASKNKKEKINRKIYNRSKTLLKNTMDFVLSNSYEEICCSPEKIFYLVGEAGYITNLYGCGRPESGSEHIYAKELEALIDVPHAIAVANGIILMSLFQDNYSKDILKCLNKLNLFEESCKIGVDFDLLYKALLNVKAREDRYTIVDIFINDNDLKNKIYDKFKKTVGDYYVDNK